METGKTLHSQLKEIRESKGYSQGYVAEQLNISKQAVSRWENEVSQTKGY